MKLKGDLGELPKVPFEFHELCYNRWLTRAFLHACLDLSAWGLYLIICES